CAPVTIEAGAIGNARPLIVSQEHRIYFADDTAALLFGTSEVLIAAKHQSFLDIMMIFNALPAGKFIMKRELLWTPIIGLYAKRLGCVPVARGKRGAAIQKMVDDVEAGRSQPGQLIIYSQGTRVAPGDYKPYKVGSAVLYQQLAQTCVPVATNVGLFWPRRGILRKPGLAVVEFLPPIEAGLDKDTFMNELETVVESRSNALMQEAGFDVESSYSKHRSA
ncbi:MAG: 1-acyl-sn-glycerol-3-phosphate acyltransferase, partial [Pseudomonadota bacterium]